MFFAERQQVVRFFSIIFIKDSKLLSDERSGKHTEKICRFPKRVCRKHGCSVIL